MVSSSSLRNVRLSTVITAAGAGVVVVVLLLLSNINVNNNNTLLQSKLVFAQLEEEEGGVVAEAEENATATTSGATNETTTTTAASPARNNNMTGVTFLFIQHAQSGSVSEVNATTFTLELSDVTNKTIMFSDRPDRIVASQSTSDFVGNWTMGEDSFAADPPNAVLVLDDDEVEQRQEIAVIELYNPEYDSEANTLRYDISTANATTTTATTTTPSINLPSEFGQSTLVIDAGGGDGEGDDVSYCFDYDTEEESGQTFCAPTEDDCINEYDYMDSTPDHVPTSTCHQVSN